MSVEPWMLRTGLAIVAINGVNGFLFWIGRWRQGHAVRSEALPQLPRVAPFRARAATRLRGALAHFAAVRPDPPRRLSEHGLQRGYPDLAGILRHAVSLSAGEPIHGARRASRTH